MRSLLVAVGVGILFAIWLPALAQSDDELSAIRDDLERLRIESEELTAQYQEAWAADAELQARIEALESSIATYGIDLRRLKDQIRKRAVELYMNGVTASDLASLFISASPADLDTRSEYLRDLRQQDQAIFNNLETLTNQLEALTENLRRDKQEQELTLARLAQLAVELNERLEEGQAAYDLLQQQLAEEQARLEAERQAAEEQARLEAERQAAEERARQEEAARAATTTTTQPTTTLAPTTTADATVTTAEPTTTASATTSEATTTPTTEPTTTSAAPTTTSQPTTTAAIEVTDATLAIPSRTDPDEEDADAAQPGGSVCPVGGFSTFSDTWGAPRSGGRRHQGVDLLAARGTPVVAVESGFVERMARGGLGGITVWLQGVSGDDYYYAHLDSWASGLSVGQEVSAGQQLGVVGTTGNAPNHIPHLHWEFHPGGFTPGGGTAVNPTPLARQLCE